MELRLLQGIGKMFDLFNKNGDKAWFQGGKGSFAYMLFICMCKGISIFNTLWQKWVCLLLAHVPPNV
jgi:hypothetical protein